MKIKQVIDSLAYVREINGLTHHNRDAIWRAQLILQTLARQHGLDGDDNEALLFRAAMGAEDENQN